MLLQPTILIKEELYRVLCLLSTVKTNYANELHKPSCSLPVNKVPALEIAHSTGNLCGDVHEHNRVDLVTVGSAQIVQQVTLAHELGDDVKGRLPRTYT